MPLLQVLDLHVNYGPIKALKGISFSVEEGSVTVLLGANGAGKTTTLKTISGLLKPVKGSILFEGRDISKLPAYRVARLGVVLCPEGRRVFSSLTVHENLLAGAYTRKESIKEDLDMIFSIFPVLAERKKQLAGTLSGGEQQMLAIARALIAKPKLLMLDEPSLGLAPKLTREIFDTILEIRETGVTILLVEQNAFMAMNIADMIYVLETGKVTLSGKPEEIKDRWEIVEKYLGG
ncbi:MAG TPA: ABC transporter ATP-binding protein [Thermotoga sp.]|nr:MAG: ABC transporter ATP-binding protein [Thermotogota bacterium]RKX51788.1 MAG: ABC transporter ATP-binding protein [Thermotoga sp.]RKX56295.1 MAG: ABC transporter ATP-binding protein [Thermotoga sp.]HDG61595.1 ABC transporter ATP-binding protein [Thermotoga sp.]